MMAYSQPKPLDLHFRSHPVVIRTSLFFLPLGRESPQRHAAAYPRLRHRYGWPSSMKKNFWAMYKSKSSRSCISPNQSIKDARSKRRIDRSGNPQNARHETPSLGIGMQTTNHVDPSNAFLVNFVSASPSPLPLPHTSDLTSLLSPYLFLHSIIYDSLSSSCRLASIAALPAQALRSSARSPCPS